MFTPRARYRFYGSDNNYISAASHAVGRMLGGDRDYRQELERKVSDMVGTRHAICVPQARFGLYLTFARLITPQRPNVVMSTYTIHDVVNMVLCAGGKPVFADIDPLTCNIRTDEVERIVDEETCAVMVTHLHGLACDVEGIKAICDQRGVPMIEDAAQSFGARVSGRLLGAFGAVGVYSFGRAKNVNAFYGGMIVTSDDAMAASIRAELDTLPQEDTGKLVKRIAHCAAGDLATLPPVFSLLTFKVFRHGAVRGVESVNKVVQTENNPIRREKLPSGYRRQLTQMQARLVLEQLPALEHNTAVRMRLARLYHEGLSGLAGIQLPPWREDGSHIYLQYPVQLPDRMDYVRYMMSRGRDLAIQHMGTASELEVFKDLTRDCPAARRTAQQVVLLPTYPGYGESEVRANIEVTRDYLRLKAGKAGKAA